MREGGQEGEKNRSQHLIQMLRLGQSNSVISWASS
jgi:hypothetical protein